MKGISLHIGINQVKYGTFPGSFPRLNGAEEDAASMYQLALDNGFQANEPILGNDATRDAVTKAISKIANELPEGGLFLLTYSGHGGQIKNPNNDPKEPYFQTWCLYDGNLVDKTLYGLWAKFKKDTRILVVSDSCYSGSVVQLMQQYCRQFYLARKLQEHFRTEANPVNESSATDTLATVIACVILFAGCQDDQKSKDSDPATGSPNSRFTTALLGVWNHGKFVGNHKQFLTAIQGSFSGDSLQIPNYFVTGTENEKFFNQKPFTIN
ncbi:hypothetical protein DBR40_21440 [Pedobacter sp. KBW01]|uniref:caspase family protein n=1 Tax=Pedobacter sp. KBW01 TaxID=2153364 RepID=UPI000F5A7E75|nr:caspase family protein [Pedobacter sp. KBW01]RQO66821.1 hypothetical protein DBR40_21440 [Pedobacter sp. KBW01]